MNPNSRIPSIELAVSEPFRVFFPVGVVLGIIGVMLWPLYEWGLVSLYPSLMHARVLILGFVGLFVLGFMGTAFPRLPGIKVFGLFRFLAACFFICWDSFSICGIRSCQEKSVRWCFGVLLFVICAMIWLGKNGSLLNQEEEPEKNNETGEERFR